MLNLKAINLVCTSGVSQGSHISLLFFNIYVNYINLIYSNILFFADDIKLFRVIRTQQDTVLSQNHLENISNWYVK